MSALILGYVVCHDICRVECRCLHVVDDIRQCIVLEHDIWRDASAVSHDASVACLKLALQRVSHLFLSVALIVDGLYAAA